MLLLTFGIFTMAFAAFLQRVPIFILFILFPLFLLSGLQFEVGTDYYSYLTKAEDGYVTTFTRKFEFGFAFLVWLSHKIGAPQSLFIFSAFLQYTFLNIFCVKTLRYFNLMKPHIHLILVFILLFYANVAANQLNLLRFYIGVPLFGIYLLFLPQDKPLFMKVFLFFLPVSFHFSFLFLGLVALILFRIKASDKLSIMFSFVSLMLMDLVLSTLVQFYSPLARLANNYQLSFNITLSDLPLFATYILLLMQSKNLRDELQPFVVLHLLFILFAFGPHAISERLSYIVSFLICATSIIVFRTQSKNILRQAQILIYMSWIALPVYKFLIFNEKEYSYNWILS